MITQLAGTSSHNKGMAAAGEVGLPRAMRNAAKENPLALLRGSSKGAIACAFEGLLLQSADIVL